MGMGRGGERCSGGWRGGGRGDDGGSVKINDQGVYNRVSWKPNLVVDRDTVRRAGSVVDWDEPADNDRFIHAVFYTKHTVAGGGATVVELHYTKLDRSGNIVVPEKPVLAMSTAGAANLILVDFPDMELDSDNRIGLVATGHRISGLPWYGDSPTYAIYYLKLDNNGEVLTGPTMLNQVTPINDNLKFSEYRWPMIILDAGNAAQVVFSVNDTIGYTVYHTRHYQD